MPTTYCTYKTKKRRERREVSLLKYPPSRNPKPLLETMFKPILLLPFLAASSAFYSSHIRSAFNPQKIFATTIKKSEVGGKFSKTLVAPVFDDKCDISGNDFTLFLYSIQVNIYFRDNFESLYDRVGDCESPAARYGGSNYEYSNRLQNHRFRH